MLIPNATEGGWGGYIVISLVLAVNQDSNTRYKVVYSGKQPSNSPLPRELSKHLRVPVVCNAKQIGPNPRYCLQEYLWSYSWVLCNSPRVIGELSCTKSFLLVTRVYPKRPGLTFPEFELGASLIHETPRGPSKCRALLLELVPSPSI